MHINIRKLEKIRLKRDQAKTHFAKSIGISCNQYYNYIYGYGTPKEKTIKKIAENLGVDPKELVED